MLSFGIWFNSSSRVVEDDAQDIQQNSEQVSSQTRAVNITAAVEDTSKANMENSAPNPSVPDSILQLAPLTDVPVVDEKPRRSFSIFPKRPQASYGDHKPGFTRDRAHKERQISTDIKQAVVIKFPSFQSNKRAINSAELVRSLIVGPGLTPASKKAFSKAQIAKVKSDLAEPKTANKVIAHLRLLDAFSSQSADNERSLRPRACGPIHAVCLDAPEEAVGQRLSSRLNNAGHDLEVKERSIKVNDAEDADPKVADTRVFPSIVTASVESVTSMLNDLHVVSLFSSDFGLGQPANGVGILSGAVPTAETIISGIELITPQAMSLGYAIGQTIVPDHTGVHPPTDRMSVLTYWWGLEIALPPPSLKYLDQAQSISHTVLTFLTALSAVTEGVRELLPFVRYISQIMEFEFGAIKNQNRGRGVVCAATWLMPIALVPRPWDFEPAPPGSTAGGDNVVPSEPGPIQHSGEPDHTIPSNNVPPSMVASGTTLDDNKASMEAHVV